MPNGLSGLTNILNPVEKAASVALPIAGYFGNAQAAQKQNSYQNYLLQLARDPAALSRMVTQATQPLSGALVQGLNNTVQGDLAQRGLAQAPGIFAQAETQALAPYLLAQQDAARNQVMNQLHLEQSTFAYPPQGQHSFAPALMAALQGLRGGQQGQQGGLTIPTIGTDITGPPPLVDSSSYSPWNQSITDILGSINPQMPTFNPDPGMSGSN